MNGAIPALAYVTLFVQDLDAGIRFYRDMLGLAVDQESERFVLLSTGNCRLGLHATEQPPDPRAVNLHFQVDDVDQAHAALVRQGAPCTHPPRNRPWGVRAADFTDPAGYAVELVGPPTDDDRPAAEES